MIPHQSKRLTGSPWGPLSPVLPGIPGLPWKHTVIYWCKKKAVFFFTPSYTILTTHPSYHLHLWRYHKYVWFKSHTALLPKRRHSGFNSKNWQECSFQISSFCCHVKTRQANSSLTEARRELSAYINVPKCDEILMVFVSTDNYLQDKLVSTLSITNFCA